MRNHVDHHLVSPALSLAASRRAHLAAMPAQLDHRQLVVTHALDQCVLILRHHVSSFQCGIRTTPRFHLWLSADAFAPMKLCACRDAADDRPSTSDGE